MTEKDFEKQMRALNEKEMEIAHQKYELQRQYLKEYPLQVDDKCVNRDGKVCWISNIRFFSKSSTSMYFLVNYPKKNGERSQVERTVITGLTKTQEDK
jgi:hypothetical protein